jgi:predicted enzyme related to lactoylglutathione lyase
MSTMTNGISWFQIGTDDPATAQRFYGSLFGWTFQADPDSPGYQIITTPAADSIRGGLSDTGGKAPNHAVFYVEVADVAATVAAAEAAGGKALVPAQRTPDGLVFAHLLDPSGNQFAIYTPPAGER